MSQKKAIAAALEDAGLDGPVSSLRDLSGGCIHQVIEVTLEDNRSFIAKINSADQLAIFEEEAAGLEALEATKTVMVPAPLAVGAYAGRAVLLMTALQPGRATDEVWRVFGTQLAALHAADADSDGRYGFHTDNHLGSTFQPNTFCDDWVEFNAVHRLGFQVDLAKQHGWLIENEITRLRGVIDRLEHYIPRKPRPSLLHGDLWSGNALPTVDESGSPCIGVIDPACYIGDGYCDLAMMRLFGGFPASCYQAYSEAADDHDRIEQRIAVYQLYHLLNHVNIFGRGYAGQVLSVAAQLGC
ncbi:MAG: fructosamine kinase family protein [Phycisphaerales bacterium]|nr:MAG: fructosamine kinase family protein [Phycisphaerales bacterium]